MKLRIRGNSVRLRVSQSELRQLAERGTARDSTAFGPGAELVYGLSVGAAGPVRAEFSGANVTVTVPRAAFERWLDEDQISIHAEQPIDGGRVLTILVEKDFTCLTAREGEDESDLFPNPAGPVG